MKAVALALTCGVLAVASILVWVWETDPPPAGRVPIGGGILLPTYATGRLSHSWWAMITLMLTAAALYFSYLFSYLYLWTAAPQVWPAPPRLPTAEPLTAAALLAASAALLMLMLRLVRNAEGPRLPLIATILLGMVTLAGGLASDAMGWWRAGFRPMSDGHTALVAANIVLQAQIVGVVLVMGGFAAARHAAGMIDPRRRVVVDNLALFWAYAIGQAAFGMALTHGFPRLAAS